MAEDFDQVHDLLQVGSWGLEHETIIQGNQ